MAGEDSNKVILPLPSVFWTSIKGRDTKLIYQSILDDYEIDKFGILCRYRRSISREIAKRHRILMAEEKMTPQEELFAKFFAEAKQEVANMSDLELEAFREGMIQVAFEARAKLSAAEWDKEERRSKRKLNSPFSTDSRNETETNAVTSLKKRISKQTPMDKVRESLRKAGMSEEDIANVTSAQTVWNLSKENKDKQASNDEVKPEESVKDNGAAGPKFKFKNPFRKEN